MFDRITTPLRVRPMRVRRIVLAALLSAAVGASLYPRAVWAADGGWFSGGSSNLLLITLDTTRADRLGCYGYEAALTPALDTLADSGTLFENAYTSCPLTLPAHATIHTGLQPLEHGLRINGTNKLDAKLPTMATALKAEGYRTGAFVAAFVLNRKFGLDSGFDTYNDDLTGAHEQEIPEELSRYRPANLVVDTALEWLRARDNADEKFFAWVHLYDPHYRYHAHEELAGTPLEAVASYDGEIAFVDGQIARLLTFLDEAELAKRTAVVAMGDHGEGLEDHGEFEHGHMLNHEALNVPLIVAMPGTVQAGVRIDSIVSAVDLRPTLLDLLGVEAAPTGDGRSLMPILAGTGETLPPAASYAETDFPLTSYGWSPLRSLTTKDWKYVRTARPELYDRRSDVREIYNLATVQPERVAELDTMLTEMIAKMTPRQAEAVELNAEERAQLEALGYMAADEPATTAEPGTELKDIKDMLPVKHMETRLIRGLHLGSIEPEEVLEIAQELVERSPESPGFQGRLGAALLDLQRFEEAVEPLREALRLNPGFSSASLNLGRALAAQGKHAEAAAHFEHVLRSEPESAEGHLSMGIALTESGVLDSAAGHFLEAIRLRPDFIRAHYLLANLLAQRNYVDEAIAHYEQALQLQPEHEQAHFSFANLLARVGRRDDAIQHYREAVRLVPEDVDARNNLAVALEAAGDLDAAKRHYLQSIEHQPGFARPYFNLGNLLSKQGDVGGALAQYRLALERREDWIRPLERIAWILARAESENIRNPTRAIEVAKRAAEITDGNSAPVLRTLAVAQAAAGRYLLAAATARQAIGLLGMDRDEFLKTELEENLARYEKEAAEPVPGGVSVVPAPDPN